VKFGVTQVTISNWENGTSEPRDEQHDKVVGWIDSVDIQPEAAAQSTAAEGAPGDQRAESDLGFAQIDDVRTKGPASNGPADDDVVFRLVPADGSAVGNLWLIKKVESLGWNADRFWRVRDRLLDAGTLIKGRGRGGSVRRRITEVADQTTPSPEPRLSESEVSLYSPLLKVLQGEWARDMRIAAHQIHFEETAKQGKKATGGTWTRPDITAVSVRSFPHLPNKYLDVWTFEAKTVDYLDVTAIFEAAAHASRATRSYALLQVPEKANDRTKEILNRCEREATRLRVGLITFVDPARFGTWETVVDAPRVDTDPELLEQFIATLSDAARRRLSEWK
jgi:hypothetical protein